MRLLLDTCTFLWITNDSPRLSEEAHRLFSDPGNDVFLSSISAWEIIIKHRLGKLPLPSAPREFVHRYRERHRIPPLELDENSIFRLDELPELHRDPFDRMLICQSIQHNLIVLTPDPKIQQYPIKVIW